MRRRTDRTDAYAHPSLSGRIIGASEQETVEENARHLYHLCNKQGSDLLAVGPVVRLLRKASAPSQEHESRPKFFDTILPHLHPHHSTCAHRKG